MNKWIVVLVVFFLVLIAADVQAECEFERLLDESLDVSGRVSKNIQQPAVLIT